MTMMQGYKQFFTPKKYSQIMINELKELRPLSVIDLAIGEGSLLKEAIVQWGDINYFGNDIDPRCCSQVRMEQSQVKCFNHDIFLNSSIKHLIKETNPVDLCIGNPPFALIEQNQDTKTILKLFNLEKVYKSKYIPTEVLFILQCLRIVSENGTIALILPDGFFVNGYLKQFRKFLVERYNVKKVIELPDNIFTKTEAKTHIIILKKESPKGSKLHLSSVYSINNILITNLAAIERMDYSYYANDIKLASTLCISDLGIKIFRGKPRYKLSNVKKEHILHTTSFSHNNIFSNRLKTINQLREYEERIAKPGDIILARVGSYCLGNVGIVMKGYFVATDCVFIIRTEDMRSRKMIFNSLKSQTGQNWIKAHAKGVAAKHITLEEIKKFPYFEEKRI